MAIGYACKTMGVKDTDMRCCLMKDANEGRLMEVIEHNIASLSRIIDYNMENDIRLFRISSDLIPFGSNSVNRIKWWECFSEAFAIIGQKIKDNSMRVSLHPGQYTVLNAISSDVVEKAVEDLAYHTRILDSFGLDASHKIVLHIGGAYKDKRVSAERFMENYSRLDQSIKARLVIENDDKIYNAQEVLNIGMQRGIPVIFDNLHHQINPTDGGEDVFTWIERCRKTWRKQDGIQKIHYSQQAKLKKKGSHSDFIAIDGFMDFYKRLGRKDLDIMLEVKDKNLSCVKCINCVSGEMNRTALEKEWNRYKYTVLERDPSLYRDIDKAFKGKETLSPVIFYKLIEQSLESTGDITSHKNALLQVWECINPETTEKEWQAFHKSLDRYQQQQTGIKPVKNQLKRLAEKYGKAELIDSYYFIL